MIRRRPPRSESRCSSCVNSIEKPCSRVAARCARTCNSFAKTAKSSERMDASSGATMAVIRQVRWAAQALTSDVTRVTSVRIVVIFVRIAASCAMIGEIFVKTFARVTRKALDKICRKCARIVKTSVVTLAATRLAQPAVQVEARWTAGLLAWMVVRDEAILLVLGAVSVAVRWAATPLV